MENETTIPAKYVEFCEQVARLARDAGLRSVGLNFSPGFDGGWNHPVQLHWEDGRHGESSRRFVVTSQVTVRAEVRPNAELCGVRSTSERALGYASAPNTEK